MNKSRFFLYIILFVFIFYTSEGFSGTWLQTEFSADADADGKIDAVTYYSYDFDVEDGYIMTESFDYMIDGNYESVTHTTFNLSGLRVKQITEKYDGSIDSVSYYKYDEDGNEITAEVDSDVDDIIDRIINSSYTYDSKNNPVTMTCRYQDGEIERIEYYSYDDKNNIVKQEVDEEGDGTIDMTFQNRYDDDGYLVYFEECSVFGCDYQNITNDSNGNMVKAEIYAANSSKVAQIVYYSYKYFENLDLIETDNSSQDDGTDTGDTGSDDSPVDNSTYDGVTSTDGTEDNVDIDSDGIDSGNAEADNSFNDDGESSGGGGCFISGAFF